MHGSRPTAWHDVHVNCVAKLVEELPEGKTKPIGYGKKHESEKWEKE
jgi:hypothetical protein